MEDSFTEVISLGKARVINGTLIPEDVLSESLRWLKGLPITWAPVDLWAASSMAIGQVSVGSWNTSTGLIVEGILWRSKLSAAQLEAINSIEGFLPGIGGLQVLAMKPETGTFEGKSFSNVAESISWESVALSIPLVKTHSIDDKISELKASIAVLEEEHKHYPFTEIKTHSVHETAQERLQNEFDKRLGRHF